MAGVLASAGAHVIHFHQTSLNMRRSLGGNRFSGTIPSSLGRLDKLRRLALHENRLSGSIPAELSELTSMTDLYLHANSLTHWHHGEGKSLCTLMADAELGGSLSDCNLHQPALTCTGDVDVECSQSCMALSESCSAQ
eukprot:TRINITY_DN6413_c0_g1_i1.p1 TRINITY_DN6413_c0_g1~~TRINITY_DN6413_c0_g1_i1.p1  ORF type:complete len:138 (+),score=20.24 TRINITY_DN6413_c0_g1_i1:313-726(+)